MSALVVAAGAGAGTVAHAAPAASPWLDPSQPLEQRVNELLGQMTLQDKTTLLEGVGAPSGVNAVGYVNGVPRLGIPGLKLTDGPAGVRDGQPATAMPAPISLAAGFDTSLANRYGSVLGGETKARGYQVLYSPMINLVRVPQGGRNFETLGEDPYLTGQMATSEIQGIQDKGVAAQVKHFAENNQENNRGNSTSNVDERTLNEMELPAFQAAVRNGRSWSAMCAYNQVNGHWSCENFPLSHDILSSRWGFDGVVASDYPATHSTVNAAVAGEDQEFGGSSYFSGLANAVTSGQLAQSVVDDQARRVLRLMFRTGVFDGGTTPTADPAAGATAARATAAAGTVLLKNDGGLLPLSASALHSIAVIGPWAGKAYTGGGGSSHVTPYSQYTVSPVDGIRARVGSGVNVTTNDGSDTASAAAAAKAADAAVVVVGDQENEGSDRPSIDLPGNDNALIQAVANANPHTVVVLNTGAPVTMPWLSSVHSLLEAWYPGEQDGNALADVVFGDVNPSGRLPVTFPTSLAATPIQTTAQYPGVNNVYTYSEGLELGYRWYDATGTAPLFPFGFGLSYTSFRYANLSVTGPDASGHVQVGLDLTNTGSRAGAEVPQVYLGFPSSAGEPPWQLKGFTKVTLSPGQTRHVVLTLDRSAFSVWDTVKHGWQVPGGTYKVTLGASSRDARLSGSVQVAPVATATSWSGHITGIGGQCVDVDGASTANGIAIQLYGCNGTAAQDLTVSSDHTVQVMGKCLDAANGGTGNGTLVQLFDCNGSGAQQWQPQPDGELLNPVSKRCLDATGASSANGTRLQLWDCTGGGNQLWQIPQPSGPITGIAGKCVDVNGAGSTNGTAIQLYDCNQTGAQDWTRSQDGSLHAMGRCLDAAGGGTGNGTLVQLFDCNGSGAQQWQPQPDGELLNPVSKRCLDATGASSANGTRLQLWDCTGGGNQQWKLP
ncbi:glycoside hydrolase family 3 C-terminal domain-containing protein [Kutzneria sp. CA-103260]|uniref:glycoside hydrolase family 3 C-terminal domain-containing protein n=1 Tax=Kutzneria sp. CA-103260 TaxID=2802641 RepID=UPI002013364E|nr:glycoside hydrolase family 3 C-terminal domain-containing protein [Kutzneria sp. CA-103260]